MNHATDPAPDRLENLRQSRPLLKIDCFSDPVPCYKVLDKPETPFWYAVFQTELHAREAWELWRNSTRERS